MPTRFCELIPNLSPKKMIFEHQSEAYKVLCEHWRTKNQVFSAQASDKYTKPSNRGFTLIEILIVIVIIGIVSGVTLYAFGDFGASRKAKVAAEHFSSYLKLLQQRAILETSTFGVNITPDGYNTYQLDQNSAWAAMPKNSFFHWQAFPSKVIVYFSAAVQQNRTHTVSPNILINSSGDMTPFNLFFGTKGTPKLIQLTGKHNGEIVLQKTPTD